PREPWKRSAYSLLERCVGKPAVAVLGRLARLVSAETEASERGDHVPLLGLLGRGRCLIALLCYPALCRRTCLRPRAPRLLALVHHEFGSEGALGRMLVVSSALQADVLHGRLPPTRHRIDVVVLEHRARRATLTRPADERAA